MTWGHRMHIDDRRDRSLTNWSNNRWSILYFGHQALTIFLI